MLAYKFMQRALLAALMLSIMIPSIGVVMVNRRTSMIGDALSHVALAGISIGLIFNFQPLIGAVVIAVFAAFLIERIRREMPQFGDMATAVVISFGLGVTSLLSDFTPGGTSLESYLFGSISTVSQNELIAIAIAFVMVMFVNIKYYSALQDIAVDSTMARLSGVNVNLVNNIFTFLSAITIALASKIIGVLLVSSLLVLPVATALIVSRSYRQTYTISVVLGVIYTMVGVVASYHFDIKPGGAIVLNALLGMLIFAIYAKLRKKK